MNFEVTLKNQHVKLWTNKPVHTKQKSDVETLTSSTCVYVLICVQITNNLQKDKNLPVKNVMGFCLQQDVQVHTPADHLGRGFHQAALKGE